MYFGLDDEQELLQETLRGFAKSELPPARLRELFDAGSGHDPALWKAASEVGLPGLAIPERWGGAGLPLLELALGFEVLGASAMPGPFLGHALCGLALSLGGSDAQRERWLPRLASGEAIGSIALAETRGWECDDWGAALEAGRLSGEKRFVPHAGLADVLVVGARGGELALVERDATGVEARPVDTFDRTRSLAHLSLRGAPAEPLPGGRALAERVLDAGRILLAADAYGAAWTLIDASVAYVKTREQFDTPLAQFQAVKHRLADMATEAEPQRGLLWYAAHTFDHLPEEAPRSAVMAKAHVTDRAVDIGRQAVELHGGIGFTWECDVQFFVKRTMFDRTWLGTPEVQRERLARLSGWSGGPGGTP